MVLEVAMLGLLLQMFLVLVVPGYLVLEWFGQKGKRAWLLAPAVGITVMTLLLSLLHLPGVDFALVVGFVTVIEIISVLALGILATRWMMARAGPAQTDMEDRLIFYLSSLFLLVVLLLPMILFPFPYGIDWVGWGNMGEQVQGDSRSFSQRMSYPPGFIVLTAFLQATTGVSWPGLLMATGHLGLLAGLAALHVVTGDIGLSRTRTLGLFCCGWGIFLKLLDSGYPTVMGLVPMVLLLHTIQIHDNKWKRIGLQLLLVTSAFMLHPSTGIFGALFMIATGIRFLFEQDWSTAAWDIGLALLFFVGPMVMAIIFGFEHRASYDEYGWQGGLNVFVFNPVLIIVGLTILTVIWRKHGIRQVPAAGALWLLAVWGFSGLFALGQLVASRYLFVITFATYAMAVTGYHVPLVIASGQASSIVKSRKFRNALAALLVLNTSIFGLFVVAVSRNQTLFAVSEADIEIHQWASDNIPQGPIFTDSTIAGQIAPMYTDHEVFITRESGLAQSGTSAQYWEMHDDLLEYRTDAFERLDVHHAILTQASTLNEFFVQSTMWNLLIDIEGARAYERTADPLPAGIHIESTNTTSSSGATEVRSQSFLRWHDARDTREIELAPGGTVQHNFSVDGDVRNRTLWIKLTEFHGQEITITINGQGWEITGNGDYRYTTLEFPISNSDGALSVSITAENEGGFQIHPEYISGRSATLVDHERTIVDWIELI